MLMIRFVKFTKETRTQHKELEVNIIISQMLVVIDTYIFDILN